VRATTAGTVRSLRAKILFTVVVCAVLPLAAVGAWLTSTAARSGELLLRSQLDTVAGRLATAAAERWSHRRSDALLLASNEPIRVALRAPSPGAEPPPFLVRAFESMPAVAAVVVRDTAGRVLWSLGGEAGRSSDVGVAQAGLAASPRMVVRIPVRDDEGKRTLGDVSVFIRLEGLIAASSPARDAVSELVAVHDRDGGGWLRPPTLAPASLFASHFTWQDHQWLAVRRTLDAPAIDIIAAGRLDPFVQPFEQTARVGAVALALVALVVVVLTIIVSGRLTGSLTRLGEAADAVAAGQFDTRLEEGSRDEVGRVARAFNTMTDSVRRMMRELSQREAVAAMGELAATLAHQVRSPATAIRLDVQRAHDKLPAESDSRALLFRALEQLDRLERAIAGSLRVARSGGGQFKDLDVREPLRRAMAGIQRECVARGVRLEAAGIADDVVLVRGGEASIEQLFVNVLMNAVEASAPNGRVWVCVASGGTGVKVVVRDEGCGMDTSVLARAGEPIFSTKPGGTGLGLAIARRIAAAHGGTIAIESEPGAGTTVTIGLSTHPAATPTQQQRSRARLSSV
jgi:signal transduction histidine kinase